MESNINAVENPKGHEKSSLEIQGVLTCENQYPQLGGGRGTDNFSKLIFEMYLIITIKYSRKLIIIAIE